MSEIFCTGIRLALILCQQFVPQIDRGPFPSIVTDGWFRPANNTVSLRPFDNPDDPTGRVSDHGLVAREEVEATHPVRSQCWPSTYYGRASATNYPEREG